MIRELTATDLPALAALRTDEHAADAQRETIRLAMTQLLPRLFLSGPWNEPRLPGFVSEEPDGRLTGMLAVAGRPMEFQGESCLAAIGADLYVTPEARSRMVGFQLLKALLNGPQDITICDIATDQTRRLWERMGGLAASSWNLNWFAVFRPAAFAAGCLEGSRSAPFAKLAATLAAPVVDRLLRSRLSCRPGTLESDVVAQAFGPAEFAEYLPELTQTDDLRPVYDRHAAEWLWRRLEFVSPSSGTISAVIVRRRQSVLGWSIVKLTSSGIATVLQIAARPAAAGIVIDQLLHRLQEAGASGATGRVQPRLWQPLADRGCFIHRRQSFALVHSRRPELLNAFRHGTAWLTPLDGEGPLSVWNSPRAALARLADLPACGETCREPDLASTTVR